MVPVLTLSAAFFLQWGQVEIRAMHKEGQSHVCLMIRTGLALETYLHCPPAHFIDGGLEDSMGQALAASIQLEARTCLNLGKARRSRARRPGEEGPSAGGHAASSSSKFSASAGAHARP